MAQESLITNNGKIVLLNRGYKPTPDYLPPTQFQVGKNQVTAVTIETTALDEPVPISNVTLIDNCQTADWNETGDADTDVVNNTAGQYIEGTGCLNLGKNGSSQTSFGYNKSTAGAYVFTAGKVTYLFVYITDTSDLAETDAIKVGFGSDTSNYYYTSYDRADLSNGWNALKISRSSASSQGTPDENACDTLIILFEAVTAATTITKGNIRMDYWSLAASNSFKKDFDSGYPLVDETNFEVEMKGTLETTDAIGFAIDSGATFNEDGTPKMTGVDTFKESSKSKDDQFILIFKDRLV